MAIRYRSSKNVDNEEKRRMAYPSVEEQLDLIWHMVDEYLPPAKQSDFYKIIKSIKMQYKLEQLRSRHGFRFRSRASLT